MYWNLSQLWEFHFLYPKICHLHPWFLGKHHICSVILQFFTVAHIFILFIYFCFSWLKQILLVVNSVYLNWCNLSYLLQMVPYGSHLLWTHSCKECQKSLSRKKRRKRRRIRRDPYQMREFYINRSLKSCKSSIECYCSLSLTFN